MEASAAPRPAHTHRRPARLLRLSGDDRLVAEIRAGSQTAFEVVYDRHHRGILGFCRHMLGSQEEAEDAVQHTFMAAYRDLMGSDKPMQLSAWLYTIARNRCLTVLRARRERPSDEIDQASFEGLASEVERRQELRDIVRDVAGLPDDQREALVLAELGDVSHDEIAQILGCPKAKVKALVFQARSSLAASRQARDTSCEEIREQLANLRGGSLRRTTLRRHVRECAGCAAFRAEMVAQRKALAVALPVIPALGFKEGVLSAVLGGGGTAGAVAAGGGAAGAGAGVGLAGLGGGVAAKALVIAAVAGGGAAGVAAVAGDGPGASGDRPAAERRSPQDRPGTGGGPGGGGSPGGTAGAGAAAPGAAVGEDDDEGRREGRDGAARGDDAGLGARRDRDRDRARDREDDRDRTGDDDKGEDGERDEDSEDADGRSKEKKPKKPKKAKKPKKDKGPRAGRPSKPDRGSTQRSRPEPGPRRPAKPKDKRPSKRPAPAPTPKPPKPTPTPTPDPTPTPTPAPDSDDDDDRRAGDDDKRGGLPIEPPPGQSKKD